MLGLAMLACEENNCGQALILLDRVQTVGGDEEFWYNFTLTKVKTVAAGRDSDAHAEVEHHTTFWGRGPGGGGVTLFHSPNVCISVSDEGSYKTRLWGFAASAGDGSEQAANHHHPHHLTRDEVTQLSCSQSPLCVCYPRNKLN